MGVEQQGNAVLGALLGELAWSPSLLAEAVNGLLGPGSVARSTVSDWLHRDRLPRGPLPTVVAHLISDTLGREVSLAELWSGRAKPAELWVPADAGMNLPWTPAGTVEVLDDWLGHTGGSIGMDRRFFPTARHPSDPCKTNSAPPAPPEPSVSREQRSPNTHQRRCPGADPSTGAQARFDPATTPRHRHRPAGREQPQR